MLFRLLLELSIHLFSSSCCSSRELNLYFEACIHTNESSVMMKVQVMIGSLHSMYLAELHSSQEAEPGADFLKYLKIIDLKMS